MRRAGVRGAVGGERADVAVRPGGEQLAVGGGWAEHQEVGLGLPNKSPQPTALSWCFARRGLPATVVIGEVGLPGPGGGWAPGR